jgi:PAS domain S-box-containing protein
MKKDKSRSRPSSSLRLKAEERLRDKTRDIGELSQEEVRQLVYELRVHQVELEMQNEELRRAQEELAESRDRYCDLFDFAPVAYFTFDQKGLIGEVNLAGANLLGVERHHLLRRASSRFIHPDYVETFYHHRARVLETKTKQTCELKMIRKDGVGFYAHVESITVPDAGSNALQIRTAITDLTERKRMEAHLIQSEKLASIGTLTCGIAHEFNNILAGILGAAELGESGRSIDEARELFRSIGESCQRGSGIAYSLLAAAGERGGKKEPTDPSLVLQNVLAFSRRELEKLNIRITEDFQPVPLIFCNAGQLSEVFLNMITNARDAMRSKGGTLTVRTARQDDMIVVVFEDTGQGIPDKVKRRIFEPFVTTKGPLGKSDIPGTGLGLYVSFGIVNSYHGTIDVRSEPEHGSVFTISIPVSCNLPPESGPGQERQPTPEIGEPLSVLLVDDEQPICRAIKKFLESKGHRVTASLTAREGFDSFLQGSFDVVLSDLTIPDMDGIELIRKIKKKDRRANIIVLTGHIEKTKEKQAREAGADEVLIKPFRNAALYETIARVCQNA